MHLLPLKHKMRGSLYSSDQNNFLITWLIKYFHLISVPIWVLKGHRVLVKCAQLPFGFNLLSLWDLTLTYKTTPQFRTLTEVKMPHRTHIHASLCSLENICSRKPYTISGIHSILLLINVIFSGSPMTIKLKFGYK